MGVAKAVETTDKIVISTLEVVPGSSDVYNFTVKLQGDADSDIRYTAVNLDLQFPSGLEVAYNNSGKLRVTMVKPGIYPYTVEYEENEDGEEEEVKVYTHTHSFSLVGSNVLRVAVFSPDLEEFTSSSGNMLKVYVKATPYLKPGDVEIKVMNVEFVTPDGTPYNPADYTSTSVKAAATSTLTLKVSAENEFSTCILPFDYTLLADDSLEAYTCNSHTEGALILNLVDKIEAYTPYILRNSSKTDFSATLSGDVDATKYPIGGVVQSGYLVGAVVSQELTEGSYVMQNQGDGAKFYRVGATPFAIPAGKCYVEMPAGTQAASFRIGSTASIENCESSIVNNELIYNLHGQRVAHMQPGNIYIVNGRMVLAK